MIAKPAGRMIAKPAGRMIAKPAGRMIAKPAGRMIAKPAGRMIAKPAGRMIAKPAERRALQPAGQRILRGEERPGDVDRVGFGGACGERFGSGHGRPIIPTMTASSCRIRRAVSLGPTRALRPLAPVARSRRPTAAAESSLAATWTAATGPTTTGTAAGPAVHAAAHPRHFFRKLEQFAAVELAVIVCIERHRPFEKTLRRRRPATRSSGRATRSSGPATRSSGPATRSSGRATAPLARSASLRSATPLAGAVAGRAAAATVTGRPTRPTRPARAPGPAHLRRVRRPHLFVVEAAIVVGIELEE